ncbi:MAG TPA: GreA/GreB family elongation factor [Burkholderiales bacterium]|nr:GreA/GreB family elongation factor [Betaproteobacteria bacterium]HQR52065.1 GreA/GreB family elongation factor [Burkholderiales bacterium]
MSRAFVKESDEDLVSDELPERPQSPYPNYVTPAGLAQLQAQYAELQERRAQLVAADDPLSKQHLRQVQRDLRYFQQRLETAILVEVSSQPRDEVHFGAMVDVADDNGEQRTFGIVGEDEADVAVGKISWASPLGKAMIGSRVGDYVVWKRPAGDSGLEVLAIRYG